MTFFLHEIKQNRKLLCIWILIISSLLLLCMLLFPSIKEQMSQMEEMYSDIPGLSLAFGLEKLSIGTPLGFYGMECGTIISICGAMFAAIIGIGMLAKEEGGHSTELIYITPNKRNYFITQKLIAVITILLVFQIFLTVLAFGMFAMIGEDVPFKELILYHTAQLVMNLEIAFICFGISSFLKKNNVGLGIGIALIFYFINIFANISDKVEDFHYVSPFYYSDAADIFTNCEIKLSYMSIGIFITIMSIAIAYAKYNQKDLNI